jgi:MerR family transcriptional regulator, copper efflux regulator
LTPYPGTGFRLLWDGVIVLDSLTIGTVAKRAGVGVETLRFYERKGLIAQPPRKESGYRQYPSDTVDRVRFIKRAKELGFSLREIRELMALRITPGTKCPQVRKRAEAKIGDIEQRIRSLQGMKRALQSLMAACGGKSSVGGCPILNALEDGRKR